MREIIFRFWHKKLNEYVENQHCFCPNISQCKIESKDCIIEQYTGLKDKNGKKIFEGDIIKHVRLIEFGDDYHTGEPAGVDAIITRIGKCVFTPSEGNVFIGKKTVEDYHQGKIIEDSVYWRGRLTCLSEYGIIVGNIHDKEGGKNDEEKTS